MKIYVAEFQPAFLALLSSLSDASPLELFSNPMVYLHDIRKPDSCPWRISNEKTVQAVVDNVAFAYHEKIETTQIVMFMRILGAPDGFNVYASLVNDAYRSAGTRKFGRSLCTALFEMRLTLTLNVIPVDSGSDDGKLLIDTFSALDWNSLV